MYIQNLFGPLVMHLYLSLYFYRPQRSCGKVMFSQASVILFTERGWQTPPPRADTPLAVTPLTDTPLADTPAPTPEMATAADGTHPTGMHSCFNLQLHLKCIRLLIFPSVFFGKFSPLLRLHTPEMARNLAKRTLGAQYQQLA